jgi:hypothetical protein
VSLRSGLDRDLAVDDVLLRLLHGGGDIGHLLVRRVGVGQADTVRGEAVADLTGLRLAVLDRLDQVEDGVGDVLGDRGQDVLLVGGQTRLVVLVGVDADGPLARGRGGLDRAGTGQ